jgi:hypothetical protein
VNGNYAVQKFSGWNGFWQTVEQFTTLEAAQKFRREEYGNEVERVVT